MKDLFNVGKDAGWCCAQSCKKATGKTHQGEPLFPGDHQLVAGRLNCLVKDLVTYPEINTLWEGFQQGVNAYNTERVPNYYVIHWQRLNNKWEPAHLGAFNGFDTSEEAIKVAKSLLTLGDGWEVFNYRVMDDWGHIYWEISN